MAPFGTDETLRRIEDHRTADADEVPVQVWGENVFTPPRTDWALLARELG